MNQRIIVTTAVPLSSAQRESVMKTATQLAKQKDFELEEVVDPSVLGGVRLIVNSQVYDATVAGKLAALKQLT